MLDEESGIVGTSQEGGLTAEAEAELADRRAQLAELFAELKRYEIVLERYEARAAQEAARREAIALDELSLEMHRRGQG